MVDLPHARMAPPVHATPSHAREDEPAHACMALTVDLLPLHPLDVDDPLLSVHGDDLALLALQEERVRCMELQDDPQARYRP